MAYAFPSSNGKGATKLDCPCEQPAGSLTSVSPIANPVMPRHGLGKAVSNSPAAIQRNSILGVQSSIPSGNS